VAAKGYPKRYAQAIYEIALEQNALDKWLSDLGQLLSLGTDVEVLALFESPKLKFEDKIKIVDQRVLSVEPMTRNRAYLLVSRNKMHLIGGIMEQYRHLLDNYRGVLHAVVTTAIPLDDDEQERIKKALTAITGKTTEIESRVDPAIKGGMVARIDGKLLEGSVRDRLVMLKKEMVGREK
jgi:F-type H+-transporting ATPase subunit delta